MIRGLHNLLNGHSREPRTQALLIRKYQIDINALNTCCLLASLIWLVGTQYGLHFTELTIWGYN